MPARVILIQSEVLGRGDDELGMTLMSNFLRLLGESRDKPGALLFWNSGIRLVCEGSWALGHLRQLESQGVEMLACATCLEYFELTEQLAVGKPTNMARTIQTMLNSDMVCL